MQDIFKGCERQCSIVLVGTFNPAMFHPSWFEKNGIISEEQSAIAQNQKDGFETVVTPQISFFKTDDYSVKIEQNRMDIISSDGILTSIKDFAIKTLKKLSSFEIRAVGFNFASHYKINSAEDYQRIGDELAPKKHWADFLGDEVSGVNRKSGLLQLRMIKNRIDNLGHIIIDVQPSRKVTQGIYIYCNDHFNFKDGETNCENVATFILESFENEIGKIENTQICLLKSIIGSK